MKSNFLRAASFAAALAVLSLAGRAAYAVSRPELIPTGAAITPDAAPGAVFLAVK